MRNARTIRGESRETRRRIDALDVVAHQVRQTEPQALGPKLSGIWAQVTEYTRATGLGKIKRGTGTWPSLSLIPQVAEEAAIIGRNLSVSVNSGWYHFNASGLGVTPRWTLDRIELAWWGIITSCNPTTGLGKAVLAEGTYPNLTAVEGATEVDVILGKYPPTLSNKPGHFIPSGAGVTPAWTLNQHIQVPHREPTTNLAGVQDDGGGLKTTCTAGGA